MPLHHGLSDCIFLTGKTGFNSWPRIHSLPSMMDTPDLNSSDSFQTKRHHFPTLTVYFLSAMSLFCLIFPSVNTNTKVTMFVDKHFRCQESLTERLRNGGPLGNEAVISLWWRGNFSVLTRSSDYLFTRSKWRMWTSQRHVGRIKAFCSEGDGTVLLCLLIKCRISESANKECQI